MTLAARQRSGRPGQRGVSLVELALILPVLLIMVFGVIDFGRALHFNNILVNISREGANLASRYGDISVQEIIVALENTAEPLDMASDGMIYVTRVRGRSSDGRGVVEAQFRATVGNTSLPSRTWTCPSWGGGGVCNVPATPPVVTFDVALTDRDTIYVVEAIYDYTVLIGYVMKTAPQLYARTIL
ncbi:MAG: pilus assembly protein [Burkholderiaceae bacterium]|nr:pilus assembly protein [Burkholderiaceae bacterium]